MSGKSRASSGLPEIGGALSSRVALNRLWKLQVEMPIRAAFGSDWAFERRTVPDSAADPMRKCRRFIKIPFAINSRLSHSNLPTERRLKLVQTYGGADEAQGRKVDCATIRRQDCGGQRSHTRRRPRHRTLPRR